MIGRTLGHYRIDSQLGQGGMGVVYRARDLRLERDVALKVLPAGLLADETARKRFRKEALALSQLNHPNIATVHDFDTEEGVDFLVLEYIAGASLDEKLAAGPLGEKELVGLAAQLALGLAAAHEQSIVHRDLKPANLRVTTDGRLKILDFGLAALVRPEGDAAATVSLTEGPTVAGTVPYMAPEQLRGDKADARADLHAAGAVLYEMATGRRAFPQAGGPQIIAAILQEMPPAPATLNPRVTPALEGIILKCLDKEPERRYQTARELRVDLERLSAPAPVTASVPRPRSRRWLLPVAAAALAAVVLVAWWALSQGGQQQIESLAVLPFANVGGDPNQEYLTDGITENLINSLSQLPNLRVTARTLAFRYKGPQVDPQKAGRDLNVRAVLTGRVVERDGALNIQADLVNVEDGSQLWGRQYSRKLSDILTLQEEIAREVSGKLGLRTTAQQQKRLAKRSTENTEAYQLYLKGRYSWNRRTGETLQRAVQYFRQAIDKDPGYALAYAGLADCYALYNSYEVEPTRECVPKAKAAATKALEIDNTLAEAHASLALTLVYDWDWAGAEREFQRSIELDPNYPTAHHWHGLFLGVTGRSEQAIASVKRAQQLDPLSMIINTEVGWQLLHARRYEEAIEQIRKALEMDPNFAQGHSYLGLAYEQRAMYQEAIAELQKAFDLSGGNTYMLGSLGHAYALSGNREKALQALANLHELAGRRYVSTFGTALIYTGLGDKKPALEGLEKAFEDRYWGLLWLKVDPRFDRLRADPRFASLLRRMGLEP